MSQDTPQTHHSQPAPEELLEVAVAAARDAGALLHARFLSGGVGEITSKSTPTDQVTESDLESERAIRAILAERRPDDALLAEEGGEEPGTSGLRWIVDPLDATINFLFGIPHWCVSIAVEDSEGTLAGAIYDPNRDELFTASRGATATLNGTPIAARPVLDEQGRLRPLSDLMIATGFGYDARVRAAQGKVVERAISQVRDIRRFGSAALDLAWTAAGRYDAYFERTVKAWDIAAGALLCEAAGLVVRELPVHEDLPFGVMAAAPETIEDLMALFGGPA